MKGPASFNRNHVLPLLLGAVCLALFFAGLRHYGGSKPVYIAFSAISLALLASAFYRRESYTYLFLAVFFWLGFWFKLTANFLWLGFFPFGEPVGNFDSSGAAWDKALLVASCAAAGLMLGRLVDGLLRRSAVRREVAPLAPDWYPALRPWLWMLAVVASVGIAAVNVVYGIHQIGMTPSTTLHWPLNALIAWMLNLGLAVIFATLVWWDCAGPRKITWPFMGMLGDALLSTISVISRASFPFHSLPQMLALNDQPQIVARHNVRQRMAAVALFLLLCMVSVGAVSFLRDYKYAESTAVPTPAPKQAPLTSTAAPVSPPVSTAPAAQPVASFRLILIHQLLVNRWIGIEGVMAVSSHAGNGPSLLWAMLTERREPGKTTAYQRVSNSGYQNTDPKYQFASLPGAVAFFYFSGSMLVVLFGMALTASALMLVEKAVLNVTRNPLICSLFGLTLANIVAQFGMTPRQDIPTLLMMGLSVLAIGVAQSSFVAAWLALIVSRLRDLFVHQK